MNFSPDNRFLALAYFSGAVQLWAVDTWNRRHVFGVLAKKDDDVYGMAFSHDGQYLAVGTQDHRVLVWNVSTLQARILGTFPYFPTHFSFSPDGLLLAVADFRGDIKVWELMSGKEHWSFEAHTHPVTKREGVQGVAFHPDGKSLVTSGTDGMVRVWNVPGKKEISHLDAKVGEVNTMALSPDGTLVAVSGGSSWHPNKPGTVRIWELSTGSQMAECAPLNHSVSSLCFSQDGKGLVVGICGDSEGEICLWNIAELLKKKSEK